jgi:signal transduction histidine kinase
MYGERDNPYAVLSRLSQRLEATLAPEAVLPTIVETVSQALKLPYAAVALNAEEGFVVMAAYGLPKGDLLRLPLVYQGDTLGQLLLAPRAPGELFTPADRRLLDDVSHQAGVAVHAVRLTAALQHSRERLVTAREEERRRLRRNLHDGLGPALASLTMKLDAARNLLTRDLASAESLLVDAKAQTQTVITDIRRLVYDLRPPALDDLGLVSALREYVAPYNTANGLHISFEAPNSLPDLPAAVEVAVYRITLEALNNVIRHAQAQTCQVRLAISDVLLLDIIDDGCGLEADLRAGVGLNSMRERAAELGGSCTIKPAGAVGTQVSVRLPLPRG